MNSPGSGATISVVMATYNGARFLEQQLESLATQTLLPSELIVSDDGSSDETLHIAERFRERAPFPVTIVRNAQRLGYGMNFLSAALRASSTYVAFCDQDDVWLPQKLEQARAVLQEQDAQLYVHHARLIDDSGRTIGRFTQGIERARSHAPLRLAPWGVFYGCTMVFERALLDLFALEQRGAHTFEHSGLLSHDLWVYFLAHSLGRIAVDDAELVLYRQHGSNQTPHVKRSRFRRWKSSLGVAAHPQLRRDEIATHRASLLQGLAQHAADGAVRARAARAAAYWRRIAHHEALRIDFYQRTTVAARGTGCARALLSGGYLPFACRGLGWRLLIKDALVGVMQARELQGALTTAREPIDALTARVRPTATRS